MCVSSVVETFTNDSDYGTVKVYSELSSIGRDMHGATVW